MRLTLLAVLLALSAGCSSSVELPKRPNEPLPELLWTYDSRDAGLEMAEPAAATRLVYMVAAAASKSEQGKVAALETATGKVLWETPLKLLALLEAVVGEKHIYVLRQDLEGRSVFALERATGKIVWHQPVHPNANSAASSRACWSVDREGHLVAFKATDGSLLFRSPQGAKHVEWPTCVGGRVFRVADDTVEAYDEASAKLLWSHPVKGHNVRVVVEGRLAYLYCPKLTALDVATGKERWVNPEQMESNLLPVVKDGLMVVFPYAEKDSICALEAASGKVLWHDRVPTSEYSRGELPVAVDGQRVYLKGRQFLYALDRKTGKQLWAYHEPEKPIPDCDNALAAGPRLASGKVWVTSALGYHGTSLSTTLRGFEVATGEQSVHCERTYPGDGMVIGQAAVEGHLVQGSMGKSYCFK